MGRNRQHVVRYAPDRCPVHDKSVHTSEGSAIQAARRVEREQGLEDGAMSWYRCEESKGWHIGHRPYRERLERSRR